MNTAATTPNFAGIEIEIDLEGPDGNAFYILGIITRELKAAGATAEQVTEFNTDATSGDYDHLLAVCANWVTFESY